MATPALFRPFASLLCFGLLVGAALAAEPAGEDAALRAAIAGPQRSERFVKRDAVRHPDEELRFFGVRPASSVIEIWPGGGYWTEILAPYLHDHGTYVAATEPGKSEAALKAKLDADPAIYGNVRVVAQDPKALDGYVRQDYAIALAERAGFRFVAASEINANPKDTANWPKGVWTLPPTYALGDTDREHYAAIGEADNFVLKFRKPAAGE